MTSTEFFRATYPKLKVGTPRWAVDGIMPELRKMEVGDIVLFPIDKYNYNTVRSAPSNMLNERFIEGMEWTTRIDKENKAIAVIRWE